MFLLLHKETHHSAADRGIVLYTFLSGGCLGLRNYWPPHIPLTNKNKNPCVGASLVEAAKGRPVVGGNGWLEEVR